MGKFKFKTNINCNSCKTAIRPFLDNEPRISKWDVNLDSQQKILTVESEDIGSKEVIELVTSAGYRIEEL